MKNTTPKNGKRNTMLISNPLHGKASEKPYSNNGVPSVKSVGMVPTGFIFIT